MKVLPLLVGFCAAWIVQAAGSANSPVAPTPRQKPDIAGRQAAATRIAEGEYEAYEEGSGGAVGPFGEEVYGFRESWTLLRNAGGDYRVEGERRFRTGEDRHAVTHPFAIELSRDLKVLSVTEFSKLRWVADSGPLTCSFLAKEMHCSIGGNRPNPSDDWHIDVQYPYGLIWPISPFSLGSLARESEHDTRFVTRASLVSIEQPSAENPVRPTVLTGELQYLRAGTLSAAGRTWEAYEFSIKVALQPRLLVWTTKKGLLLVVAVEHEHANWPNEGLRLVRYEQFADF